MLTPPESCPSPLINSVSCISCCFIKVPEKGRLRKDEYIGAHSLRVQSTVV